MTESFLTTDIIVIIVLFVVLGSFNTSDGGVPLTFYIRSSLCSSHHWYMCLSSTFLLDEDWRRGNLEHGQMEFDAQFILPNRGSSQPNRQQ